MKTTMAKIKFLVIQHKKLGDVIASTVICEYLKKKYRNCEVHYLINSSTVPVVLNHPCIDQVIEYKAVYSENMKFFKGFIDFLQQEKYDVAIDAYCKPLSALISWRSRAKVRVSFHKWYSSFLYTKTVHMRKQSQTVASAAIENRLMLVMKTADVNAQVFMPKIHLSRSEVEGGRACLLKHGLLGRRLVMLNILGSSAEKSYPAAYMAKIVGYLIENTAANLIVNHMPQQAGKVKQMIAALPAKTKQRVYMEPYGKGLRSFLSLLHWCDALIGNEGGASNMAKSMGIPSFSIFSPSIDKDGWMMFEDDAQHMSVHLKEFKPKLFNNLSSKQLKKQNQSLYQSFEPHLMFPKLKAFCQRHLNQVEIDCSHANSM